MIDFAHSFFPLLSHQHPPLLQPPVLVCGTVHIRKLEGERYLAADIPAWYCFMDNSIHHLNPLAVASVRLDPDAIWVGLNSDTALIRDSTIVFKDLVGALTIFQMQAKSTPLITPATLTGTGKRPNGPLGSPPPSCSLKDRGMEVFIVPHRFLQDS